MPIIYEPSSVGKIVNKNNKQIKIRKYHIEEDSKNKKRTIWEKEIENVNISIKEKANKLFFNPYRKGIYYYQIQTLFLLGSNEWHNLKDIIKKMEEYVCSLKIEKNGIVVSGETIWKELVNKEGRGINCKDFLGRVQENFILLQRLSKNSPYGYKLHQVGAAIDIKKVSMVGFNNGLYFYRLSTYSSIEEAYPIRDYKDFDIKENEYNSSKFIGTIITKTNVTKYGF